MLLIFLANQGTFSKTCCIRVLKAMVAYWIEMADSENRTMLKIDNTSFGLYLTDEMLQFSHGEGIHRC